MIEVQQYHKSQFKNLQHWPISEVTYKVLSSIGIVEINLTRFKKVDNLFQYQDLNMFFLIDDATDQFLPYYHKRNETIENGYVFKLIFPNFQQYMQTVKRKLQILNAMLEHVNTENQVGIKNFLVKEIENETNWQTNDSLVRSYLGKLASKILMLNNRLDCQELLIIAGLTGQCIADYLVFEKIKPKAPAHVEFCFLTRSSTHQVFPTVADAVNSSNTIEFIKKLERDVEIDTKITLCGLRKQFIEIDSTYCNSHCSYVETVKQFLNTQLIDEKVVERLFKIGAIQHGLLLFCIIFMELIDQHYGKELFGVTRNRIQTLEIMLSYESKALHQIALICFSVLSQKMFRILTEIRIAKPLFHMLYNSIIREKHEILTIKDPKNYCDLEKLCTNCQALVKQISPYFTYNFSKQICDKCAKSLINEIKMTQMTDFCKEQEQNTITGIFGDVNSIILDRRKNLLEKFQNQTYLSFLHPMEQYLKANTAQNMSELLENTIKKIDLIENEKCRVSILHFAQIPKEITFCLLIWHFGFISHKYNIYLILQLEIQQLYSRLQFLYFQNCPQIMHPAQYLLRKYVDIVELKTSRTQFLDINYVLFIHRSPECAPHLKKVLPQLIYLIEKSPYLKQYFILQLLEFTIVNQLDDEKRQLIELLCPQWMHFHTYNQLKDISFVSRYEVFRTAEYEDLMQAKLFENLGRNKYLDQVVPQVELLSYATISNLFRQGKIDLLMDFANKTLDQLQQAKIFDESIPEMENKQLQKQISLMHFVQHIPFFPHNLELQNIARRTWELCSSSCDFGERGRTTYYYLRAVSALCVKFEGFLNARQSFFLPIFIKKEYQIFQRCSMREVINGKSVSSNVGYKNSQIFKINDQFFCIQELKMLKINILIDMGKLLAGFDEFKVDSIQFVRRKEGQPQWITQAKNTYLLVQLEDKQYLVEGKDVETLAKQWGL